MLSNVWHSNSSPFVNYRNLKKYLWALMPKSALLPLTHWRLFHFFYNTFLQNSCQLTRACLF